MGYTTPDWPAVSPWATAVGGTSLGVGSSNQRLFETYWGTDRLIQNADFDIQRPGQEHLAFGYGVHRCLGAPLARMEAAIALPAIFDRFPDLELAVPTEELVPIEGFISGGYRTLPVRLTPVSEQGS